MESRYRAYTAHCILIQDLTDCGQFSLLTTSWPDVWGFSRALFCNIPYTDFAEFTFHALR
jgi:hypothetical protein